MALKQFDVNEDFMRGIPEFVLRQATEKYIDEIKQQVFKHILGYKSHSEAERVASISAADEALSELENEVNDLLENALRYFMQQT
jgi:hypothetical protein